MNCSEDGDFWTGTESLFFNLMQQRSDCFTADYKCGDRSIVCQSVCLSVFFYVYLFCSLSMHTFCHTGNRPVVWSLNSLSTVFKNLNMLLKCCLKVLVEENWHVSTLSDYLSTENEQTFDSQVCFSAFISLPSAMSYLG